jgi:hypothetical protein
MDVNVVLQRLADTKDLATLPGDTLLNMMAELAVLHNALKDDLKRLYGRAIVAYLVSGALKTLVVFLPLLLFAKAINNWLIMAAIEAVYLAFAIKISNSLNGSWVNAYREYISSSLNVKVEAKELEESIALTGENLERLDAAMNAVNSR